MLTLDEFYHLVAKYSEEWLNFIERFQETRKTKTQALGAASSSSTANTYDDTVLEELELAVANWSDIKEEDQEVHALLMTLASSILTERLKVVAAVTRWLSDHDQYVYKTVYGAASYYQALIQLAISEGTQTCQIQISDTESSFPEIQFV